MRSNDTRGSMPFAVVAVTILLVSVAAAAVTAGYQRSSDNADGVYDDVDAVDDAIADITSYVNRGLGEIVREVSVNSAEELGLTDASRSELELRSEAFDERVDRWIGYQFPIRSGGALATYVAHSVDLTAETLGVSSSLGMDGYTPAYLRGKGTITVVVESQSGRAETEIPISTDGSYDLPLAVERASLFEAMAGGDGISLSQMMEYQLAALAQYRILDGYGATAAYGERGTDRIVTSEDVAEALSLSLDAIAAICFRDGSGHMSASRVDLADVLAAEDGRVTVDLTAVYAQAMMSAVDDIALRWMDYLYGYEILGVVADILDPFRDAIASLDAFIRGEERVSGVPYLRDVMRANGIPESDYRYPGSGTTTVSYGGVTVTVANPTTDVLDQPWLKDFKKRYDQGGDFVRDNVADVLRSAAVMMAERLDLGTITVTVDPHDDRGFLEQLAEEFLRASEGCLDAVGGAVGESLSETAVYDEFYGCLADEISSHAGDLVLDAELGSRIRAAFEAAVGDLPEGERPDVGTIMSSPQVSSAIASYRAAVHSDMAVFDALRTVEGDGGGLVKRLLTVFCSYGMAILDILVPVERGAVNMVNEAVAISGTNPYGGVIDLPDGGGFELVGEDGGVMRESLSADVTFLPGEATVTPVRDLCVHTVGFRENPSAAFSTTFRVHVTGTVQYTVTGSGSLSSSMGTESSVYGGTFDIDATVDVTVTSGWALAGLTYEPSVTVLDDIKALILMALEPIIEPLRTVLEAMRGALVAIGETIMDVAGFLAENLVRLYNLLMDPIGTLSDMISDLLEDAVFDLLVGIDLGQQRIQLNFFGCSLVFATDAVTWTANTKTVMEVTLTVPIAGLTVTAGMVAKIRGDVSADNLFVTGFGGIEGDGWSVEGRFDPFMKGSKYMLSLDGEVGDTSVSLVAPKLDGYHETGFALSDIPGLGTIMDNIPIPMLGVKIGLDVGVSVKFGSPNIQGLLINEIETNPEGTDKGNEWVELLNNTGRTVDLDGYTLRYGTKSKADTMALSGSLSPGEFLVIKPSFTLVNTSGRTLTLLDAEGEEVDSVPVKADGHNDGRTWQRESDGSSKWVLAEGTMGRSNEGPIKIFTPDEMKHAVWEGVQRSFDRVGTITDLDSLASFVQYLVRYTIEDLIDTVSAKLIEASIYAKVDVKDMSSSLAAGVEVALRTDGDLVKDCLRYLSGQVQSIVLGLRNPYSVEPVSMFAENVDLQVTFHAAVGFPDILSNTLDRVLELPRMDLCVVIRANLASLTSLVGVDTGDPGIDFGIMARDCPAAVIDAIPRLSAKEGMSYDLWLFRAEVSFRPPGPGSPTPSPYMREAIIRAWPRWTSGYRPSSPRRSSWRRPSTGRPRSARRGSAPSTPRRRRRWRRSPHPGTSW